MLRLNRIVLWSLQLSPVVCGSSFAWPAAAQTDSERAMARAAAEAGDIAFKEGRYEEAADYFARAESVMHAPTLLLHLARSHVRLGRYVLAREAFIKISREVLAEDAPPAFRAAQDSARRELSEVEKKIAQLTIKVAGPPRDSVRVSIDGQPIPSAVIGLPYPSDPGSRVVEVSSDGYGSKKLDVDLKEGAARELAVTLAPLSEPPEPGAAPVGLGGTDSGSPAQPNNADNDSVRAPAGSLLRTGAYVGFGVGLVGAGLGTLFVVQRSDALSEADDRFRACSAGGTSCSDPGAQSRIKELDDKASGKGTLAVVSYAVGGAGIVAGVALLLFSGSGEPRSASIAPYFTGSVAGVLGRF